MFEPLIVTYVGAVRRCQQLAVERTLPAVRVQHAMVGMSYARPRSWDAAPPTGAASEGFSGMSTHECTTCHGCRPRQVSRPDSPPYGAPFTVGVSELLRPSVPASRRHRSRRSS